LAPYVKDCGHFLDGDEIVEVERNLFLYRSGPATTKRTVYRLFRVIIDD